MPRSEKHNEKIQDNRYMPVGAVSVIFAIAI